MDRKTNRQTPLKEYAPYLWMRGHKKLFSLVKSKTQTFFYHFNSKQLMLQKSNKMFLSFHVLLNPSPHNPDLLATLLATLQAF